MGGRVSGSGRLVRAVKVGGDEGGEGGAQRDFADSFGAEAAVVLRATLAALVATDLNGPHQAA